LPHSRRGEVGINRLLETLRGFFNWAVERGYYDRESPFLRHGRPLIKFSKEAARERRLQGDEEARLIRHASPHLKALVIAALDTGMRRGELLNLRWRDVLRDAKQRPTGFVIRAEHAKTGTSRTVPIASQRLLAILEMRRAGPDG